VLWVSPHVGSVTRTQVIKRQEGVSLRFVRDVRCRVVGTLRLIDSLRRIGRPIPQSGDPPGGGRVNLPGRGPPAPVRLRAGPSSVRARQGIRPGRACQRTPSSHRVPPDAAGRLHLLAHRRRALHVALWSEGHDVCHAQHPEALRWISHHSQDAKRPAQQVSPSHVDREIRRDRSQSRYTHVSPLNAID